MADRESSSRQSVPDKGKGKRIMPELPSPPPPHPDEVLFTSHFEKVLDPTTGRFKAICNHCGYLSDFAAEKVYGKYSTHLNKRHPQKISHENSPTHSSQGSSSTGTCPSEFIFSHSRARTAMAKYICAMSLPLNHADSVIFETTMKCFNPLAKRIPRSELVQEIKKLVAETLVLLVKDFVKLPNKVSICSDVWSDPWGRTHYVAITCRWIDEKWSLQKRLVAFKCFFDEHSASEISHQVHTSLQKYGLVRKVFSISFDRDSANASSLDSLVNVTRPLVAAKFFHVRCMSYVLTVCAEVALNALTEEVAPIRKAASILFRDYSLTKKWGAFCRKNGLHPRIFKVDLSGRWDLTCKMLNGTYEYRDALCSFFSKECADFRIVSSQWDACYDLCKLLKTFKDAIEELSGVYYPTSVLFVDHCVKIAVVFNSLIGSDGLGDCSAGIIAKWLEHFLEIPNVFLLAKVFDPRVRLDGLETMLEIYYDALFPTKDDDTPLPSSVVANVRTSLYEIFEEYRTKHSENSSMDIISTSSVNGELIPLSVLLQNLYDKISRKRPWSYGSNPYGELEYYLTATFEYEVDAEFDVLRWWSRMTMQFPIMSLIAKDILAVPASTASVEQAFSTGGGYVLNERQSMMSLRSLENQLLLGDWKLAEDRCQENDYDDDNESDSISDSDDDDDEFD